MKTAYPSSRRRITSVSSAVCVWLAGLLLLHHSSHAFLTPLSRLAAPKSTSRCVGQQCYANKPTAGAIYASSSIDDPENKNQSSKLLKHSDIEWRLRPPEGTSLLNRLKLKAGANILRMDAKLKSGKLPPILCPRGGQAVLEAYYKGA
jgi:hypothetical protein